MNFKLITLSPSLIKYSYALRLIDKNDFVDPFEVQLDTKKKKKKFINAEHYEKGTRFADRIRLDFISRSQREKSGNRVYQFHIGKTRHFY